MFLAPQQEKTAKIFVPAILLHRKKLRRADFLDFFNSSMLCEHFFSKPFFKITCKNYTLSNVRGSAEILIVKGE